MDAELSFGEWLRRRRRGQGLTQVQLGQRAGYSGETIRKVEADELRPSRHLAESLAAALDLTPAERAAFVSFARGERGAATHAISTQTVSLPPPVRHNLPTPPTPLLGRDVDVAALRALLLDAAARLVTLTGVGGTGKTRLAVAAAAAVLGAFPDGVAFVDLSPLRDLTLVAPTIAQALRVRDTRGRPIEELLQEYLRAKSLLLLLDNFEHLLDAAPLVADLLAAAPRLKVLVTSREVLRLRGEHVYAVEPLAVPPLAHLPPLERLADYASVTLFSERAADAAPGFHLTPDNAAAVAGICARLDGLPLAIELAAAHVRVLPPADLLVHLDHRLVVLTHGARDLPTRQQTLRAEIGWSYDLLTQAEQALFRRLAVVVGGATLEAIAAVVGSGRLEIGDERVESGEGQGSISNPQSPISLLDGVESLVAKSLLIRREGAAGEARFGMLETIREYALERLRASGETEAVRQAHAAYFLRLAETAEPHLEGVQQVEWLDRLERDLDNLRAAIQWPIQSGDVESGLRLAVALHRFWNVRAYFAEGIASLRAARETAEAHDVWPALRARALQSEGRLAYQVGDHHAAHRLLGDSLALFRHLNDPRGTAEVLEQMGDMARYHSDEAEALALQEASVALFRQLEDKHDAARALRRRGQMAWREGALPEAVSLLEASLILWTELQDKAEMAYTARSLGFVLLYSEDYEQARLRLEQGWRLAEEISDKQAIAHSLRAMGLLAWAQHDYTDANKKHKHSLALWWTMGTYRPITYTLAGMAGIAAEQRQLARAVRLLAASETTREEIGVRQDAKSREFESAMAALRGQLDEDEFASLWAEGAAMTLEEAVAYALEEGDSKD